MRKLLLAASLALITGCATANLRADFEPRHLGPGEAAVIISVTNHAARSFGGCNYLAPEARFVDATGDARLRVKGHHGKIYERHLLNQDGYPIGRVALLGVQAGTYRLAGIDIDCLTKLAWPKGVPDVAFTANAGEIVYVGNLDTTVAGDRAYITATNEWPRDSASVREKWPNLPLDAVVVRLLAKPTGTAQRP